MRREDAWFVVPAYGFGPGFPKSWQGWLLLLAFIGVAIWIATSLLVERTTLASALLLAALALFLIIARAKSTGPWKWRWGRDEHTWRTPDA